MKKLMITALLCGCFATGVAAKKMTNVDILAKKVVELRAQVENLSTEYHSDKEELRNQLKSVGAQQAQVNSQISQEEIRQKQASKKIATLKNEIQKLGGDNSELRELVNLNIRRMKKQISSSIPFKKRLRVESISEIEEKLAEGVITPEAALGRTWAAFEDELRLTRDNSIHSQTIQINGEELLVSVAKVGMMMMYFHTVDNRVGYIDRNINGEYIFVEEKDKGRKELILKYVDGLQKQIRFGYYTLPMPYGQKI